jgi:NADPH:quinone reductase-like Zn-dependent oxidoreductase
MKTVTYNTYGKAEVLKVVDTPRPKLKEKEDIIVKVMYSSLNAIDWKNRKGHMRIFSGLFKPSTRQGFDFAGIILEKGPNVTQFNIGDKVLGQCHNFSGGALSQCISVKPDQLIKAPKGISDLELAGLPMAGTTAWKALVNIGKTKPGMKVLINGGSSGVGHLAIQIAKAKGAHVTSISSTKNLDFCKMLGADELIDYTKNSPLIGNQEFDIIFDVVFNLGYWRSRKILKPNGIYIGTTPTPALLMSMLLSQRAKFVAVQPDPSILYTLTKLMLEKKVKVHIKKVFLMEEIIQAHQFIESSRTIGKVIVKVPE